MFFFFRKRKHKKKNKTKSFGPKSKEKKRFGLTANEMDELIFQMAEKPKIPIVFIK